ncbi:enolase C-terminal domain-like protein [Aspergillus pseudoustus]|uniref:Enolase C-terminal domain-like protein n=1 Tax=Aspergillus pseudoustus TaxID=1810923 RepID=A0ABR4J3N1_9EURO
MGKIVLMEYFRVPLRWLFVKITDDTGACGWGEASLEGHTGAVEECLDAWFERYNGLDADDIDNIWQLSWRGSFYRGGPVFMSALSGIDIAHWDLKAKKLGVPIYHLLGGKVRDKIRVYAWVGGDRPTEVEAQTRERMNQGFHTVKMNGTGDTAWLDSPSVLAEVVKRLKSIKALGVDVAIDFHGRVHRPMAKQLARLLAPLEPLFIEEPLLGEHIGAIKQVSDLTTVPLALGERLYNRWDPDICHVGGILELRRIAAMCETYDVGIAPHCPLGPIALAANMQVNATLANFAIQEMGLGMHYNNTGQDITSYIKDPEVWKVRDGHLDVLPGPGLGIESDELEPTLEFRGPCGELREW